MKLVEEIDANVVFLRHTLAPGFGDPDNFSINDYPLKETYRLQG